MDRSLQHMGGTMYALLMFLIRIILGRKRT